MYTFILGTNGVSNWVTAHLLAVVLVYPLIRTKHFNSFVRWVENRSPINFFQKNSRWIAYILTITILGGSISVAMSLDSGPDGIWASILTFTQNDAAWRRYSMILHNLLISLGLLASLSFIPISGNLFSRIYQLINEWRHTRFRMIRLHKLEILTPDQLADLLILLARYLRYTIIFLVLSTCLTVVFSLYPETEGVAQAVLNQLLTVLNSFWDKILEFLPNMLTLTAIILVTKLALRVLRFFYDGMIKGKIRYSGIDLELVEPTFQLLRFMIIAFALVAAFPYIPGSSSPVFKGLSIFVGFLLSLGSTSLVSNIVAGIVLTYTRGLRIGDRVQIADSTGDVIERTALVTRIRTIKNVIISIPNNIVLQNQIINYSAEAAERGLILHTSVTIGYDVPWRLVTDLMVGSALKTKNILEKPAPFVLKTSLDDFYITYELNAYTDKPGLMAGTYSELHQNILDQFNKEGVEIMSPSYFAVRDGQSVTIPQAEFSGNGKSSKD
jgi:small-conductance mechanosensitive channel